MHQSDIYYRITALSDESLISEEQTYRCAVEGRECRGNFNYNERIHIRICMELMRRGIKPNGSKEVHNEN